MPDIIETIRKILDFENPPHPSWRKPSGEDINTAVGLIAFGQRHGIKRFNAFSDYEGDYEVNFYIGNNDLDIIHNFGCHVFDIANGDDYLEDRSSARVLEAIKEFVI